MANIEILKAEPPDLQKILEIQKSAFLDEGRAAGGIPISPLVEGPEDLEADFKKLTILKAVDEDGEIIGSVRGKKEGGTVFVYRLSVKPERRKKGAGGLLLDALEKELPSARYELRTRRGNDKAENLYRKHGYRAFKEEFGEGDIVLVSYEKTPE
ncbi:MAG: GNAT family N-acetyltransferase [Deltaproteobacteria bacterium]|jgi:ribosomal protein S18 acetylase RimI-like enzyme|nr:GNAT family N-acetyltransferase [Deltaproteobacteria bacterium]